MNADETRWSREDVQRVLYNIIRKYEQANEDSSGKQTRWRRRAVLGGDSELLRDAIRIGRETLKENDWWPGESDERNQT